jgi:hypothetical protein
MGPTNRMAFRKAGLNRIALYSTSICLRGFMLDKYGDIHSVKNTP